MMRIPNLLKKRWNLNLGPKLKESGTELGNCFGFTG